MSRQIRPRFFKGKIEPLEQLELQEGEEIIISVEEVPVPEKKTRVRGKSFTANDSLWNLAGIGQAEDATDVSQNKHKYLADAYAQHKS
jgi:predicted DNA-binding antitoxin AbrB/MazE fold protein